ncbi:hypothetical protein L0337_34735 [candidate division KSB1 bacterium]|nr:hypothetical protein [candidate division KSB1 bacterium]
MLEAFLLAFGSFEFSILHPTLACGRAGFTSLPNCPVFIYHGAIRLCRDANLRAPAAR